jgi:hypothetical protein
MIADQAENGASQGNGPGRLPLDAAGRNLTFFEQPGVDELLSMVLELAAELWVVRERLYRFEAASQLRAPQLDHSIGDPPLTPAQEVELARLRDDFTRNLFRSLHRRRPAKAIDEREPL